ncbi:hypothetical protein VTN49DRAFT_2197 [Thermomyces lanuginosus]|uniref:uncharacterized protein n=1 Tax=Thermomyces lanuginosus TaxID=5541 RepID=UPI0037447171
MAPRHQTTKLEAKGDESGWVSFSAGMVEKAAPDEPGACGIFAIGYQTQTESRETWKAKAHIPYRPGQAGWIGISASNVD